MKEERKRLIHIMPFKELRAGNESIYDNIDENYTVPEKVIDYLKTTQPYCVCMGLYKHPFKEDVTLSGPYWYSDGEYCWDRDAWKYVVKYHVKLPQSFIDKVMSDEGTEFLEKCKLSDDSWAKRIQYDKKYGKGINLMPDDAGDEPIEKF